MSNEVATQENAPVSTSEVASVVSMIERAAVNPLVDIDKMERLLEMQERILNRQAEAVFTAALADLQSDLPAIKERGSIKDRAGNVQSTYALWEDINDAIKPVLQRHGFALSFRTDFTNGISVTGVLSHKCGHREQTSIVLPADTSGSKNSVQSIGSSVSYGKRYAAGALLNLTSHGEDDDGKAADPDPVVSQVQATMIAKKLAKCSDKAKKVFADMHGTPEQVAKSDYDTVDAMLEASIKRAQGGDNA